MIGVRLEQLINCHFFYDEPNHVIKVFRKITNTVHNVVMIGWRKAV